VADSCSVWGDGWLHVRAGTRACFVRGDWVRTVRAAGDNESVLVLSDGLKLPLTLDRERVLVAVMKARAETETASALTPTVSQQLPLPFCETSETAADERS
jgi:hypothetical protein